jgi:starvation-inducible DNA-binding protein
MAEQRTAERERPTSHRASLAEISHDGVEEIIDTLHSLLADVLAVYVKTKRFSRHVSMSPFREWHRMLGEQAVQLLATTDVIAERLRNVGAIALHSSGEVETRRGLIDHDAERVAPPEMLGELAADNTRLTLYLRAAHEVCGRRKDFTSAGLIVVWIDESDRRSWFLSEAIGTAAASH